MKERIQTEPHNVSINTDPKSPFWFCSFTGPDGQQKRRSTKVPVGGGLFRGEKLSAKQAEKRALLVGAQLAERAAEHYITVGALPRFVGEEINVPEETNN